MSRDTIFKCLIAFILGYIYSFCMIRVDGLSLDDGEYSGTDEDHTCFNTLDKTCNLTAIGNGNNKCFECAGKHQPIMHHAKCKNRHFDIFCNLSPSEVDQMKNISKMREYCDYFSNK